MKRLRIDKSGSIGYLADADISSFEQPVNSWSRVDNMRMRNHGCETILDRVVAEAVVNSVSELSYINNSISFPVFCYLLQSS